MACRRITALLALVVAAAVVGPTEADGERLPLRTLTTANGLANNVINRIVGDSRGFVWFCTREGLARFDGHGFTNFGLAEGLPNAVINGLVETRSGNYWIATGDGLVRFDPHGVLPGSAGDPGRPVFTRHVPGPDHRARAIGALLERGDGDLWVGTALGLFRLHVRGGTWRFDAEPLPGRTPEITALAEDAAGTLWIGTSEGLFAHRPGVPAVSVTTTDGLPGNRVLHVYVDRRQRVWAGTTRGLAQLRPGLTNARPVVEHVYTSADGTGTNWFWQVVETWDGTLWAATDVGLVRFVASGAGGSYTFKSFGMASGLPSHHVSALAEDRNRNLWIGTRHGAARLLPGGFTIFGEGDGVPTAAALSLTPTGDVLVMEAVDEWRVNRYDGRTFVKTAIPLARLSNSWGWNQMFVLDRDGTSWLGSRSGVWRFRGSAGVDSFARATPLAHYTSSDGLAADVVLRLFEDSRGDVWVGTAGEGERRNGLSRWDRACRTWQHYTEHDGLPSLAEFYVSALAEDESGSVWVGLSGAGGLARYRDGHFSAFSAADGVPVGAIRNLVRDSKGRLWGASYQSGVIRIDAPGAATPRFLRYSRTEGLSSNEVGAMVEDARGRIHVGTARGLDVVEPESGRVQTYRAADGLPPGEAQAAARDASGALWFTYLTGVVRLLPGVAPPPVAPRVFITGVRAAGKPFRVSLDGEAVVPSAQWPHTENAVDVDFLAPGFGPRDALFQVRLDGGRNDWSEPSEQRSVSFANLAPGRYRFAVRAVTPTGETSPDEASFAFTIVPPIWRRWWFAGSAALVAALALRALYQIRTARERELGALRARIASDLHDDIGANLTRVVVLSELVRRDVDATTQADRHLQAIASVARDSIASMGDIVWMVDPERDTVGALASKIREHAGEVLGDRDIELAIDTAILPDTRLSGDVRRDVYLVAKEAVTNAARHAQCSAVTIRLAYDGRRLLLTVADNGVGFTPDSHAAGHGLTNMHRRALRLHASLEVTSAPGAGTRICLDVRVDRRSR